MKAVEWLSKLIGRSDQQSDKLFYFIDRDVIYFTEKVLSEYGKLPQPNEGLVYWCGNREKNKVNITSAIAPETDSSPTQVSTSYNSNAQFVRALSENNIIHIGQVHSHPGTWVDHSEGDDRWAPFKIRGLLSIVIPVYGKVGMQPLYKCGVHRFDGKDFNRLSINYVKKHFTVAKGSRSILKDFRT
jgi:hypothetical protein